MKSSELALLSTPDTLKLGTSSFGLKNSTYSKNDMLDNNNTTNLLQSSLRGIFTENNIEQNKCISNSGSGDNTYQKMQSNLRSLQDKIKDLEGKLSKVNTEDSQIIDVEVNNTGKSMMKQKNNKKATNVLKTRESITRE